MEITRVGEAAYQLGESPLWDPEDGVLYWVDSLTAEVFRHDPAGGAIETWKLPGSYLGSLALRESGGAVVAMDSGFHFFDFDTGACETVAEPEADEPRTAFNDGKVDRRGRFVAGSLHSGLSEPLAALWRLDADGAVSRLDDGFICTNGPCWSRDGKTLYLADSSALAIYAYDYDLETGAVADRRVFFSAEGTGGLPDGATVDAEGYVWSAQCQAGCVLRLGPGGQIDRRVELPVAWVASLAFGGPGLDVLYVTSIGGEELGERDSSPQAGGVFAIEGLGARGLPEPRFKG